MKKGGFIWGSVMALFVAFLVVPATHEIFISFTASHAYLSGFIKFAILSTMGELLAIRISTSDWTIPKGAIYRALVWGFLGMAIVLMFEIFSNGVIAALAHGKLPGGNSTFLFAFFTSAMMNLTFGPAMMGFHRVTDTYIDLRYEGKLDKITIKDITSTIDWNGFVSFTVLKTIPFFWIPAHTVVFLLPAEYRVLGAAMLSIALGVLLAFGKKKK